MSGGSDCSRGRVPFWGQRELPEVIELGGSQQCQCAQRLCTAPSKNGDCVALTSTHDTHPFVRARGRAAPCPSPAAPARVPCSPGGSAPPSPSHAVSRLRLQAGQDQGGWAKSARPPWSGQRRGAKTPGCRAPRPLPPPLAGLLGGGAGGGGRGGGAGGAGRSAQPEAAPGGSLRELLRAAARTVSSLPGSQP